MHRFRSDVISFIRKYHYFPVVCVWEITNGRKRICEEMFHPERRAFWESQYSLYKTKIHHRKIAYTFYFTLQLY
ncbi:hypothetical protein ANTRET_LOCUS9287 [Anthophora retusa]